MFRRKKAGKDEASTTAEVTEEQLAAELAESTEATEEEKAQRRLEREERKFQKEQKIKSLRRQRFVAPILLLVTIFISFLIWRMGQ